MKELGENTSKLQQEELQRKNLEVNYKQNVSQLEVNNIYFLFKYYLKTCRSYQALNRQKPCLCMLSYITNGWFARMISDSVLSTFSVSKMIYVFFFFFSFVFRFSYRTLSVAGKSFRTTFTVSTLKERSCRQLNKVCASSFIHVYFAAGYSLFASSCKS